MEEEVPQQQPIVAAENEAVVNVNVNTNEYGLVEVVQDCIVEFIRAVINLILLVIIAISTYIVTKFMIWAYVAPYSFAAIWVMLLIAVVSIEQLLKFLARLNAYLERNREAERNASTVSLGAIRGPDELEEIREYDIDEIAPLPDHY